MDSRNLLAAAIVFGVLVGAWMFRYDSFGPYNASHRNRFTWRRLSRHRRVLV